MDINLEIQNFPFWDKLNEKEKRMMINGATYRKYDKNQMVYGYSDACLGIIYVKKGGIRVYTTSEDGREVTFFHIEEGDFCILSASCVIGQMMIDVQLLADEETELLAIHSGTFAQVMDNNIYVKAFAFELSTTRMTSVVWVMQQILFDHFDERLARFLLSVYEKTGEKKIKMTQEYVAQEVNSAREVVARMLKQFASDGWIEINRRAITLKDIEALENLVK